MEGNRKKFRVSVKSALIFEVSLIVIGVVLGYLVFPRWEEIWLGPTMVFIYLLICTAPLAYLKGFDFSLHDVEGCFLWVHYHFFSIFVAAFTAPFLNTTIYTMIGELKLG